MAHGEENLTGIHKYLNSSTMTGRANTAKVTLGALALIIAYNVLKPKKVKQPVEDK